MLERGSTWGEGCSWGNAGLIVPSHARPIAAPENLRAGLGWVLRRDAPFGLRVRPTLLPWLARYVRASTPRRAAAGEALQRALASESLDLLAGDADVDAGFRQDGCLSVFTAADGPKHAAQDAESSTGRALAARGLHAGETRALEPALSDRVTAGVLYPHVDPVRLTRSVGGAARRAGVVLRTHLDVTGLRSDADGVTVETSTGPLRAGHVVIAAGAWSGRLARTADVHVPLQGGKGYAIELARDAVPVRRPIYLHDERCVATPLSDRTRITGGLVLDGLDERFDARRIAGIRRAARARLQRRRGRPATVVAGSASVHA